MSEQNENRIEGTYDGNPPYDAEAVKNAARALGRLGRAKNTEAQKAASRLNGARGGRPVGSGCKVRPRPTIWDEEYAAD
jgi:cytochrome c556